MHALHRTRILSGLIRRLPDFCSKNATVSFFYWGPVPHFCPLEALQPVWLTPEVYCTIPRISNRSYSGRQAPLASTTCGSPLAATGGTMGDKCWPDDAWDMYPGFFYMPQICDMGPIILLPFRRKAC
jgi:hypothetical protein